MEKEQKTTQTGGGDRIGEMFEAGAHYGYSRSRRHPSTEPYIFGLKNQIEIIDLEKTRELLSTAEGFVRELGTARKTILFVGTKPEAREPVKSSAESAGQSYVIERWVGGTLTNFSEIKKRVEELTRLREERESGELAKKYTKHERLMVDREIARLEERFGGLVGLTERPAAMFVVDPRFEHIAVAEAKKVGIPIIALAGSDCDVTDITYPIIANDTLRASVTYFTEKIARAYKDGTLLSPANKSTEAANEKQEKAGTEKEVTKTA